MHAHTLRRRVIAASAGLAVAATPFVAATAAQAEPSREATTSVDTSYLADALGLPANTIVETVTYDRFQWLLRQPGQFAFLVGTASDAGFKEKAQAADQAARDAGATKIYWFDPNLSGFTGIKSLDTRNPGSINLAANSQTIFGNVWKNVLGQSLGNGIKSVTNASGNTATITADDLVINDSVDPAWDFVSGHTQAAASTDDVFFVYDKDNTVSGAADKIVDWVNLSTSATVPAEVTAAFTAIGGGAVIDQIGEFKWWQSENNRIQNLQNGGTPDGIARYGGDILQDSDAANGWNVEQLTYPELLHVLNLKEAGANFAFLFGGTWCPNTRAVVKFVNDEAIDNNVKVYNFDLVLDGGKILGTNGGSNPLHVRDNANSGSTFNFRPSWVYGDVARGYFKNLVTQYDPQAGNRVAFYPGGDLTAFPDVARKLQVPFLIGYERGTATNASGTAVKRQWIQQNLDANTGLPTFTEYMSNWWYTNPSAQIGLGFSIADETILTDPQKAQLAQARSAVAFGQEAVQKLDVFFGGLPGGVTSTRTVTADDVAFGSDATINLAIENKYGRIPAGVATLAINGVDYPVAVAQNAASFTVPAGLAVGAHSFTISYASDAQLKGFTESGTLNVVKADVATAGTVTKASTPQTTGTYKVTVTQPSGAAPATGAVAVTLKNGATTKVVNGTVAAGEATIALPKLPAGTWTASVAYAGDANYAAKTAAGASVVSKKATVAKVAGVVTKTPTSTTAGAYKVTVTQPAGLAKATGKVKVTIKRYSTTKTVTGTLSGGVVTISVPKLSKGTWSVSVAYAGDANYNAKTATGASIKVAK